MSIAEQGTKSLLVSSETAVRSKLDHFLPQAHMSDNNAFCLFTPPPFQVKSQYRQLGRVFIVPLNGFSIQWRFIQASISFHDIGVLLITIYLTINNCLIMIVRNNTSLMCSRTPSRLFNNNNNNHETLVKREPPAQYQSSAHCTENN